MDPAGVGDETELEFTRRRAMKAIVKVFAVATLIGMFVPLLVVQAIAAEQESGVTKQPKAESPTTKDPRAGSAQPRGFVVNELKAQPGFVFEAGPNNQVRARKAGGGPGGLGASASCGCDAGQGTCTLTVTGGTATCWKDSGNTCNGYCNFTTTQPSLSPGTMMRK